MEEKNNKKTAIKTITPNMASQLPLKGHAKLKACFQFPGIKSSMSILWERGQKAKLLGRQEKSGFMFILGSANLVAS